MNTFDYVTKSDVQSMANNMNRIITSSELEEITYKANKQISQDEESSWSLIVHSIICEFTY